MTPHEAKLHTARLMVDQAKHWKTASDRAKKEHGSTWEISSNWAKEDTLIQQRMTEEIRQLGERYAADPAIRESLAGPWTVRISGTEPASSDTMAAALKLKIDVRRMVETISNLARQVRATIERLDYKVTDSSGGVGGWDMGFGFLDTNRASALCSMLHERFALEIQAEVLTVAKQFTGWYFPELRNWEEAEGFLEKHGIN